MQSASRRVRKVASASDILRWKLGQLRDEKEQVVLKGEQCRDEHGHRHQEYILQA